MAHRSSKRRPTGRDMVKLGLVATAMGLGIRAASAVDVPRPGVPAPLAAETNGLPLVQVRAHGGGGGGRGGFRGGGFRGYGGYGFYGGPAYYYGPTYYYGDCRTVRVRQNTCWRDSDGDRHCGDRWVVRQVCD